MPTVEQMLLPTVDECRFDVDVVYTWVDGDDEDWLASRDARITGLGGTPSARAGGASRYRSRDELRYSMRSLHLFAPWVRRIHLVTAGEAEVEVGGQPRATLRRGQGFGEISLIDGEPRSATVRAGTDGLQTFALSAWEFRPLLEENPSVAFQLLKTLSARLRAAEAALDAR